MLAPEQAKSVKEKKRRSKRKEQRRALKKAKAVELVKKPGVIELAEMRAQARKTPTSRREHKPHIDVLAERGAISERQFEAAKQFLSDFHRSGLDPWATSPDNAIATKGAKTPGCGPTCAEYMAACKALGPLLAVVAAVVLYDLTAKDWAKQRKAKEDDGIGCLRLGLDTLCDHYWR